MGLSLSGETFIQNFTSDSTICLGNKSLSDLSSLPNKKNVLIYKLDSYHNVFIDLENQTVVFKKLEYKLDSFVVKSLLSTDISSPDNFNVEISASRDFFDYEKSEEFDAPEVLIEFSNDDLDKKYLKKYHSYPSYFSGTSFSGTLSISQIISTTISQDLVSVQPLPGPTGQFFYLDYVYDNTNVNRNERRYSYGIDPAII